MAISMHKNCGDRRRVYNVCFIMVLVLLSAPLEGHTLIVGLGVFIQLIGWLDLFVFEFKTNVARVC
jgi:hypothetical protein